MERTVIEARDLGRRYGGRWACARIDLDVRPGERLLVLGANGSGKTTLLRLLATAIRPTRGALRLFGEDASSEGLVRRVALLTHALGLYEDLSARENLEFLGAMVGRPLDGDLFDRIGVEDRDDPVRVLSAGQRKRVALGGLLLKEPELVLLDEPFGQLDPRGMEEVAALVRSLPGTVILASHQVERAAALCDRALLLDRGLPRWTGPASHAWAAWRALHQEAAA